MIENESELDAPDGEPVVHGDAHRKLSVTDGPFAETKEGLGGLRTIEVWADDGDRGG